MSDVGIRVSPIAQNLLVAVLSPVVAVLIGLYITQQSKVEAQGQDIVKMQTILINVLDLDKKVEEDLSSISNKYIDVQVTLQMLKGTEQQETDAVNRVRDDLERSTQDRISDIRDLRKRVEEVEKTFAPIHGNGSGR